MSPTMQLTEDEKQLVMELTNSPDAQTAQIAAVREYLRYMRRKELIAAAGTIEFDEDRVPDSSVDEATRNND
jgi:hypothetical protein